MQETREHLSTVVQMAVSAGQTLPYVQPDTVAEVLQSMHHGLINRWLADGARPIWARMPHNCCNMSTVEFSCRK